MPDKIVFSITLIIIIILSIIVSPSAVLSTYIYKNMGRQKYTTTSIQRCDSDPHDATVL